MAQQPPSRWLTDAADTLGFKVASIPLLDRFVDLGLPVLKKFKSGFVAEPGDILFCLLLHVEDDGGLRTQVCHLDDTGQMQARVEATGALALSVLKAFLQDFPAAVLTTAQYKPLCLFAQPTDGSASPPADGFRRLGLFQGYMSWETFQRVVATHAHQITVAVP